MHRVSVVLLSLAAISVVAAEGQVRPKGQAQKSVSAPAGPRPSPFQAQKAKAESRPRLTVPSGTEFSVRLGETLDTKRVHEGDRFTATLDTPITVRNRVLVPKGTVFLGHVAEAKASGRLHGRGVLGLTLDSFQLHGTTYPVQTTADVHHSGDHKRRDIVLVAGGTGVGAVLGKVTGVGAAIGAGAGAAAGTTTALITGKRNVKVPVETPLVFSLRSKVDVRS
jgi:hypothetical protein